MKIKYQDSIVAFVDVLGFSRLVYASDNAHLEAYFNYVIDDLKDQLVGTNFEYLLISDSIVVSAANSLANLKLVVKVLSKIQSKLLCRGILLRGAIAHGGLYVNRLGNVVVGPGLIRAYEMENAAVYPRIIIDRTFISLYYASSKRMMDDFSRWLTTDEIDKYADGVLYINYPRYIAIHNTFYANNRMGNILALLKEHYYSNEHYVKYDWLLRHLIHQFNLTLREDTEMGISTKQRRSRNRKILEVLPQFLDM